MKYPFKIGLLFVYLILVLTLNYSLKATAQTTTSGEIQKLVDHLTRTQPDLAKEYKASKKKFDEWEKKAGKDADKYAQSYFDDVFGKDKLKPSDALNYLAVIEAVYAGDYKYAGTKLSDMLVKCEPKTIGLGCYIKAVRELAAIELKAVEKWEAEIYQTQSFKYFRYDFAHLTKFEEMIKENPKYEAYVPSYMVSSLRNNPHIGSEMKALYAAMLEREQFISNTWSGSGGRIVSNTAEERKYNAIMSRSDAYNVLLWGEGWINGNKGRKWYEVASTGTEAAKWRSRIGYAPGEREGGEVQAKKDIFNHFLQTLTSGNKDDYMVTLSVYYLDPIIEREAKKEQKRIEETTAASMRATITAMKAAMLKAEESDANAEVKTESLLAKYRKYLDDGLANKTIYLPIDMTPDQAFQTGLQAVERNENYYKTIDMLTALALKQAEERAQAEQAQNGQEDPENIPDVEMQEETPVDDEAWLEEEEEESFETDTALPLVQVDALTPTPRALVGKARRECLMSYDFSGHKQADILALLPRNLQSDPEGENVKYMLGLIGETCKPGYMAPINDDADDGDDWADVDEDLTVSYVTEAEKWAMRDALSAKRKADAAQSDERYNQQYASIEAQREEEAQRAAARAAAFGSFMQDLAVGVAQVADQIETENRAFDAQLQQHNNNMNNVFVEANKRDKFMRSCMNNRPSTPGFASGDPNGGRIACGQNYRAKISGTSGNGNTYDEQLKAQQAQTARRRAEEQRRLIAERKANAKKARDRVYAQAQCSCYQAGKSSGRQHSSMENSNNFQYDSSKRPSNCARHIMGPMTPWLGGYYDGKAGNDNYSWVSTYGKTIKWCRF